MSAMNLFHKIFIAGILLFFLASCQRNEPVTYKVEYIVGSGHCSIEYMPESNSHVVEHTNWNWNYSFKRSSLDSVFLRCIVDPDETNEITLQVLLNGKVYREKKVSGAGNVVTIAQIVN